MAATDAPAADPDQPREFYDHAADMLGDPRNDLPMTVRVEDYARRMGTDVMRAVRTTDDDEHPWLVIAASIDDVDEIGTFLDHDDVSTWPVCSDAVNRAAFALTAGRSAEPAVEQSPERGDMHGETDIFRETSGQ